MEVKACFPLYISADKAATVDGIYCKYAVGDKGCRNDEGLPFFSLESLDTLSEITETDKEYSIKVYKEKNKKLPPFLRSKLKVVISSAGKSATVYAENEDIHKFIVLITVEKIGF